MMRSIPNPTCKKRTLIMKPLYVCNEKYTLYKTVNILYLCSLFFQKSLGGDINKEFTSI